MVSKGASARVVIKLRSSATSGKTASIPIETFASNKNMGRILLRRSGETVAAGETRKHLSSAALADPLPTGIVMNLLD